jgi:hypothetical protein
MLISGQINDFISLFCDSDFERFLTRNRRQSRFLVVGLRLVGGPDEDRKVVSQNGGTGAE